MGWLDGDLADIVADSLEAADLPITMHILRTTASEPPPDWPTWEPWDGDPVTVEHPVRGWIEIYSALLVASGAVNAGDVKIMLIQKSLPFRPELNELIRARGETYTVLDVKEDPAQATLELRAKK